MQIDAGISGNTQAELSQAGRSQLLSSVRMADSASDGYWIPLFFCLPERAFEVQPAWKVGRLSRTALFTEGLAATCIGGRSCHWCQHYSRLELESTELIRSSHD